MGGMRGGLIVTLLLGCAPGARGLGALCDATEPCDEPLTCVRGLCVLPEEPVLDAGGTLDAPRPRDAGAAPDAPAPPDVPPVDAGLVPRLPPLADDTGPALPRPPEATHTGTAGPFAIALDWERHRLFASHGRAGTVEVVDLTTGDRGVLTMAAGLHAERMCFDPYRDELVISLPERYHDAFWFDGNTGFITTIDPATLVVAEPIRIVVDPWDVAADGHGLVVVSGGSGQWTDLITVDLTSGRSSVGSNIYMFEALALHPSRDRVYGGRYISSSQGEVNRYEIIGRLPLLATGHYFSGNHGSEIRVDPTGRLAIMPGGFAYALSDVDEDDITAAGTIPPWRDAAFHPAGHRLFVAHEDGSLVVYESPSLAPLRVLALDREVRRVFAAADYLLIAYATGGGAPVTEYEVRWYESL